MKVPPYTLVRRIGATRDEPLARHPSHAQRVGLWDVSSQVGRLTDIITVLNDANRTLHSSSCRLPFRSDSSAGQSVSRSGRAN